MTEPIHACSRSAGAAAGSAALAGAGAAGAEAAAGGGASGVVGSRASGIGFRGHVPKNIRILQDAFYRESL